MWEPDPPEIPEHVEPSSEASEPVQSALRLSLFWTCIACLVAVFILWILFVTAPNASAQGPLSTQVLQLLSRVNTWTQKNTYLDLRLAAQAVPSDTALRLYIDNAANLYFNGALVAGVGGVTTPHNLLSTTHPDTVAIAVARGAVLVGNATPAWSRLSLCPSGNYIGSNGTDTVCATSAAGFTAIPAAQLTGTSAAIVGTSITALNASNLSTGTVPLARLSGLTNTQIDAAAAIAYSKLNLTGLLVNADLTANTLLFNRWATNGCINLQVPQFNGAAWVCKTLIPSDLTGGGTVTSVAMTVPAGFAIGGSPITTAGTLALSLSTETANFLWAGPTTGAASAPTFRALVNADLPLTGVVAGTYPKVTLNTAGVATAAAAQITLTTDVTGTLPRANGGTGVAVSADDTILVGSGTAWVAQALPNCPTGSLAYTQATNLFNCTTTGGPTHAVLSATHSDTLAAAVVRGSLIVGNSTPAWSAFALGTAGQLLAVNAGATDPVWTGAATLATSLTVPLVTRDNADLTLSTTTAGNVVLNPIGDIKWGKAIVALGGGAAPTLGTIGGTGPAAAGQNGWMRVVDSTGTAFWVPIWR